MAVTINGVPITRASITENRVAAWTALVEADTEDAITGQVTLDIEGEAFAGTVVQSDVDFSRWKGLIVGGGGGLQKVLEARYYVEPTLGVVLTDIARDAGESLDPTIPSSVLARKVPRWARLQGDMHTQLRQVADELGVDWRMTRAGLLWLGEETWPTLSAKYLEQEYDPDLRMLTLAYEGDDDRPVVRPGVDLDGRRVERVVTTVTGSELRQDVYFDETKGQVGLVAVALKKAREVLLPKLQLARFYAGRVIGQSGQEVTLLMDDPLVAGRWKGLDRVPLVFGLPGVTVQTQNGSRVRLFWDAGNPTRPRAALWDQGAPVQQITLTLTGVGGKLRVEGDLEVTGEVRARADGQAVALSTHVHPTAMGPSGTPTPEA